MMTFIVAVNVKATYIRTNYYELN